MSVSGTARASRTAMMVAAFRGRAALASPALYSDPWAVALAGDEGLELAEEFEALFPAFELWMAVRTAYLDAHVKYWTATAHKVRQVVLLGAGLDTRAARLACAGVRFFEVDHPASQAYKREQVARLSDYPVDAATYVACDFERDDFAERLCGAGFDRGQPALILWEGVVPYLTEVAVRATLQRLADTCEPRSVLVFDYIMKRLAERQDLREGDKATLALVDRLEEPVRFGTNDPLPMLYECGFRHVRTVSFDQACLSLTGTYERSRLFRFQHLATASRTAHSQL